MATPNGQVSNSFAKEGTLRKRGFLTGSLDGEAVYANPESSVLMFGPPGSGKSLTFAANLVEATGWDAIVYDPPGTIRKLVEEAMVEKGYAIRVINMDRQDGVGFNPMTFLKRSEFLSRDLAQMVELLMPHDNARGKDGYFGPQAQNIATGYIKHMWTTQPDTFTLGEFIRVFSNNDYLDVLTKEMQASKDADALIASSIVKRAGTDNEKGGLLNTITKDIKLWADDHIDALALKRPRWDWESVFSDPQPSVTFIEGGMGFRRVCGPFARMVIGLAVLEVQRMFNRAEQRLPKGLRIFIDEAKELGRCNAINETNDKLRKADARTYMGWLALPDLHAVYGDEAKGMFGTSTRIITGGIGDHETLQTFSNLIGKRTVRTKGESKSASGRSDSEHDTGVPVIYPDQIGRLPADEQIVLLSDMAARVKKPWHISGGKVILGVRPSPFLSFLWG